MKNLDINNFKFKKNNNDYLYIVEIKNSNYILKRILNNREIVIIKIFNNSVEFECIKNNKRVSNLDLTEKDKILDDIINTLKFSILKDFINFDALLDRIKETYMNVDYSNNLLGLSVINNHLINIILLKTKSIIGNIKIDYDVKINVEEKYIKDSLELLESYIKSKNAKKLLLK